VLTLLLAGLVGVAATAAAQEPPAPAPDQPAPDQPTPDQPAPQPPPGSPPEPAAPADQAKPAEQVPEQAAEPPPAAAPPTVAPGPSPEELQRQIAELKALLAGQQALIEAQKKKLAQQEGDVKEQSKKLEDLTRQLESATRRLDELQQELPSADSRKAIEERLKRVEASADKVPELPPDVVSAGDFPGSIRIPGTDAAVKFGGRVRAALVVTLDPLGSEDRFLTNSIPVEQPTPANGGEQTNINANTSRFNFELRTPTGAGQMRAFVEGDFFGAGNSFRLRHAYGQFHGFLAGQTWSTFSDPAASHEDLDFEGVSSENVVRQPQMRYTWTVHKDLTVAAALETPKVSVTGGTGSDLIPDMVGRVIWRFKGDGHLQGSAVVREIRATPDVPEGDPTAPFQNGTGWGLSLSGVVPFKHWYLTDRFIFQLTGGRAIARYINDLSSLTGLDGVFDATGDLHLLPMWGWYLDYEHVWKEFKKAQAMNLRSSFLWSVVHVNNPDFMPDTAYKLTHRLGANVIFSPMRRMDVGLEYIWGTRENKNDATGTARQIQLVTIFRF
jgi:flagellar motor protein MotB